MNVLLYSHYSKYTGINVSIAHVRTMLFVEAFGLQCLASLLFSVGQFWECLSGLLPLITFCLAQMVSTEGLMGLLITQSPSSEGVQEFGGA